MRRKLALRICPDLKGYIADLESGNTKVVLENARLHDLLARMVNRLKRLQVKCDDCKPRNPVMGDIGCIIRDEDF